MEQFAVSSGWSNYIWGNSRSVSTQRRGESQMPAFTFEKISPPVRRGPIPPIVKKQRGLIVQILDSFVEARVKKNEQREDKGVIARREKIPPD
jgi:hypothetical protein